MHCVLNVGGNWNNRSNAGLFYFNGNNSTSNSNSNIGAHIIYKKLATQFFIALIFPHLLVKIARLRHSLVVKYRNRMSACK